MASYAGIGSRNAPPDILEMCTTLAERLAKLGYTLRSGGADGCDSAFEKGARRTLAGARQCEIFLPWRGFNNNLSTLCTPSDEAYEIASIIHPNWNRLREPIKKLVARNMHQILGGELDDPVNFVLCWTCDGATSLSDYTKKTGGTGSAIALASYMNIPVFNLYNPLDYDKLLDLVYD